MSMNVDVEKTQRELSNYTQQILNIRIEFHNYAMTRVIKSEIEGSIERYKIPLVQIKQMCVGKWSHIHYSVLGHPIDPTYVNGAMLYKLANKLFDFSGKTINPFHGDMSFARNYCLMTLTNGVQSTFACKQMWLYHNIMSKCVMQNYTTYSITYKYDWEGVSYTGDIRDIVGALFYNKTVVANWISWLQEMKLLNEYVNTRLSESYTGYTIPDISVTQTYGNAQHKVMIAWKNLFRAQRQAECIQFQTCIMNANLWVDEGGFVKNVELGQQTCSFGGK